MAIRKSTETKVRVTTNYRLFGNSADNRTLDVKRHKKLKESMKLYGFLACFPIICCRGKDKKLIVKDGQHRLAFAEELGLPVHWIEETIDFDVAIINNTPRVWALRDYAEMHSTQGRAVYQEGLAFAESHRLPVGMAFALLAGTTTFSNIQPAFVKGTFVIKDRTWADAVAGIYVPLVTLNRRLRTARMLEACMAVCRVKTFQAARLIQGAERCRDKLVPYSTREAYLEMLESIYNFGRSKLFPLKVEAVMAMKRRSAASGNGKTKPKNTA